MARGVFEALRELVERVSAALREGTVVDAYLAGGTAANTWVSVFLYGVGQQVMFD